MTSIANNNNLIDKICSLLKEWINDKSQGLSLSVKEITQEAEFVDILQSVTDYGNTSFLNSFSVRLEMDCNDDNSNSTRKEESRA